MSFPGLKAFRQQLRKNTRTKGLLGLNKIKGLTRQVFPPLSSTRGSRGAAGPAHCEHRSMLEEVLHQQRWDTCQLFHTSVLLPLIYLISWCKYSESDLWCVFQDATDPAPTSASDQSCSHRTNTKSPALSGPAAVTLSSTFYGLRFPLHVWHGRLLRPALSASFAGFIARRLENPQDLLLRRLLIPLVLLRLLSVPRGLRRLPSRGSSAHQPANTTSAPHHPPTAAPVGSTRHLPHPV